MKIIEAMKLKKELQKKAETLRLRIRDNSAQLSIEKPVYGDSRETQEKQINEWLQAHADVVKEMRRLSIAIQTTNLKTKVEFPIAGKMTKLTVAELILRRREHANMEKSAWESLTNKGLRVGQIPGSDGKTHTAVDIVLYFDPKKRDEMVDLFNQEPHQIDAKLEVVNATTDLVGLN